jgi:myosin-5
VDITMAIIKMYLDTGYAKGKTKIFLKGGQMAVLEKHRTGLLNKSAITIQKYVRGHLQGGHYRKLRKTALLMQSFARMAIAKRLVHRMRCEKAALKIQTAWRGSCARADYKKARNAVITIQSAWRGKTARKEVQELREERAATCIQRWYRGHLARKAYKASVRKVVLVQCAWRCKMARKELRARKAEARNTGKLMEDKANLEKQLKDMQVIVAKMQDGRKEDRDKMKAAQEDLAKAQAELANLRTQARLLASNCPTAVNFASTQLFWHGPVPEISFFTIQEFVHSTVIVCY